MQILTSGYTTRAALAYATSRAVVVVCALSTTYALTLRGEYKVIALGTVIAAAAAGVAASLELAKRAGWYREPGHANSAVSKGLSALGDGVLALLLCAALTSADYPRATYPGAAVAKSLALLLVLVVLRDVLRAHTPVRVLTVAAPLVRGASAVACWIVADKVVPASWRAQQALEVGAVVTILGIVALAVWWRVGGTLKRQS